MIIAKALSSFAIRKIKAFCTIITLCVIFQAKAKINETDSLKLDGQIEYLIGQSNVHPDSVLNVCLGSLKNEKILASPYFESAFYSLASISELKRGDFENAQLYIQKAISLREEYNYPLHLATSFEIYANILTAIGEVELSRDYLFKSLELKQASGNPEYLKGIYSSIGKYYYEKNEFDSSNIFYTYALDIYLDQNDLQGLGATYNNLANNKYNLDDNEEAIADYQQALAYYLEDNRIAESARPLMNIGEVYRFLEVYDSAKYYFKAALSAVNSGGNKQYYDFIYDGLANTYIGLNQPDSAVFMYQKYVEIRDSFYTMNKDALILEFDAKHKASEAKQVAAFEKAQKEKFRAEGENKKLTIYLLLCALGLVIIGLFFWWRNLRQKSRLKSLEIETKNQEIDALLKDQEAQSYASLLEGQNSERERIAQDLHDRLGGTLAAVKVHFGLMDQKIKEIQSENKELFDKVNGMLSEAVQDVRRISHDLVSGRIAKLGLRGALEDLAKVLSVAKKMEVDFYMDDTIALSDKKKEQDIYAVIQELVSNMLKHANATAVDIQLNRQDDLINVIFEDNGVGFSVEKEVGKGLGISGISKRVKALNGTLNFDSVIGRGTIVIINIPL